MFMGASVGGFLVTGALVGGTGVLVKAGVLVDTGVDVRVGLGVVLGWVVVVGKDITRVATGVSVTGLICGLSVTKSVPPISIHPSKAMLPAMRKGMMDERVRFCGIDSSYKIPGLDVQPGGIIAATE